MNTLIFDIPRNQSVKATESLFRQHFHLRKQVDRVTTRTYLDTFDWRVFKSGGVLEAESDKTGIWLTWRSLGADQVYGRYPVTRIPRFVSDLKVTGFRKRLEKVLGVRAMVPIVNVQSRSHVFTVLNLQAKTVLRIEIQSDRAPYQSGGKSRIRRKAMLGSRIHVFPMKGYEKTVDNACTVLQEKCHLIPAVTDPVLTALAAIGCEPGIVSQKPTVADPVQRTDTTAKYIFRHLLETMVQNENGVRQEIDSEFLHDFRVAVRRTRSLLVQMNNVLSRQRISGFSREFSWLGKVTGPSRDMDVYLLSFDSFKLLLPKEMRKDLMPLQEFLGRHRVTEYQRLIRVLDSERYRLLKRNWKRFLGLPPPKRLSLQNAGRPIIDVASEKIWHVYRKAINQGNLILPEAPATSLHQLRKTCKKLRYLIEFFQDLYKKNKVSRLINSLKVLQNNLGEYQDLVVQQITIKKFIHAMEEETGLTDNTRNAMEMLVFRLEQRNLRVRMEFAERFSEFSSPANHKLYRQIFTTQKKPYGGTR